MNNELGTRLESTIDVSHATPELVELLTSYFADKSAHDVDKTMSHFSQTKLTYIDAQIGSSFYTWQDFKTFFTQLMPTWPAEAKSYPVRILGDSTSALVFSTNMPQLFGSESRLASPVNFENGKVVRWVDYWDGRHFGIANTEKLRLPANQFPQDFKESTVGETATPTMRNAANALVNTFAAGDWATAGQLFSRDAVFEDLTLHMQMIGQLAITAYLKRSLSHLPYGPRTSVRHIVGSTFGGGYEWISHGTPSHGVTGLELNSQGLISRLTAIWDGSLLDDSAFNHLLSLTIEH